MIEPRKSFPQSAVSSLDNECDDCCDVALAFVRLFRFRVGVWSSGFRVWSFRVQGNSWHELSSCKGISPA